MHIVLDDTIPKPDFVIIGTQKGGTTWLRKTLRSHPDIYIPPFPEEVHFFNRSLNQPDLYLAMFHHSDATGKVRAEKSPNYFHMPEKCIRFMSEFMPNVQLVLLLRDPVERAWSQARMQTSNFNQKSLTQKDLLKLVLQVASRGNFERTNYPTVIQRWLKYFSKEQLHVYYYDDLQVDPQGFLDRICQDLKVATFQPEGLKQRVHVSKSFDMPVGLRWFLQWRYRRIPSRLAQLGYQVPETWSVQDASPSLLQRFGMLLAFLPYNLLTTILYQYHKIKTRRAIQVPTVSYQ